MSGVINSKEMGEDNRPGFSFCFLLSPIASFQEFLPLLCLLACRRVPCPPPGGRFFLLLLLLLLLSLSLLS